MWLIEKVSQVFLSDDPASPRFRCFQTVGADRLVNAVWMTLANFSSRFDVMGNHSSDK